MTDIRNDIMYNYPKSSCDCYKCESDTYENPSHNVHNNANLNCLTPDFYNCYNSKTVSTKTEPTNCGQSTQMVNPTVLRNKFDKYFGKCKKNTGNCSKETYLSSDPRLYNAAAATWLQLDRPPLNSATKLNTLTTDSRLDGYGQNYRSHSDIDGGQILYYKNKNTSTNSMNSIGSRGDTFPYPLYDSKAQTVGNLYQDPMGVVTLDYTRVPHEKYKDPVNCDNGDYGSNCYSWMRDSQFQREDILSRYMVGGRDTLRPIRNR